MARFSLTPKQLYLFEVKFVKGGPDDCWPWLACTDKDGYGLFKLNGSNQRACRVSYDIYVGEIPFGLLIRHKCDNPPCVNPKHLAPGTVKENSNDMMQRGGFTPRGPDKSPRKRRSKIKYRKQKNKIKHSLNPLEIPKKLKRALEPWEIEIAFFKATRWHFGM